MLSSICDAMWQPQRLRHHGSTRQDAAVKDPTIFAGKLKRDMSRNGVNNKENALTPGKAHESMGWDASILQQI